MKVVGEDDECRELDAVVIAKHCVFVGEYKKKMTWEGALQLTTAIEFLEGLQDINEGSGPQFKGKRIFGVLAGCVETSNTKSRNKMDDKLAEKNILKWFEGVDFGPDPNIASPALSYVPAAADGPVASPGNGNATTTPAALPRRVRQVGTRMRRAQLQVRPRLVPKFAGFKSSSLI